MDLSLRRRPAGLWLPLALVAGLLASRVVLADVPIPEDSAKAIALGHQLNVYWVVEKLLALGIPAWFLFSGTGARVSNACRRLVHGRRLPAVALFGCVYVVISAALTLPFNYLRHFRLPTSLGIMHESFGPWLQGQAVGLIAPMLLIALFSWIPYGIIKRSPRRWWLWSTVALVPVVLFALVVQPLWSTRGYPPIADKPLETMIGALAQRCGIRNIPIVVGGDDTSVLGLGPSNRVILQQDLSKVADPAQTHFTIGHELKHYVMGDNWKALLIITLLLLSGFWITHRVSGWVLSRWPQRVGFNRLEDPASVPLLVLCMTALWIAVTPAFLAFDRHIEREADRFGLELTHENQAAARMFAGWVDDTTLAEPGWFERTFRDTHPSPADRMRMANSYQPWRTGMPLRYGKDCSMP